MKPENVVLEVDREHRALQAAIIFGFFLSAAVSYFLIGVIFQSPGINLIAAAAALGVGFLVSKVLETWLKGRWSSGRRLHLEANRFYIQKRQKIEQEIQIKEGIELLFWRFKVKRGGRIPKGWFLLGCALLQDGEYLPVYSFTSAQDFEKFPDADRFIELAPKKNLENDSNLRLLGLQKRLHTAEVYRWNEGSELKLEDFRYFVERISIESPTWGS